MPRYNLYSAIEMQGTTAPGVSSGEGIQIMSDLATSILPDGISYEWTDLSYQETHQGTPAIIIFRTCGSVRVSCTGGPIPGRSRRRHHPHCADVSFVRDPGRAVAWFGCEHPAPDRFVVLVGLAAKNAILIVELQLNSKRKAGIASRPLSRRAGCAGARFL